MPDYFDDAAWRSCRTIRLQQRRLGAVSAVLLVVVLLGLIDGLQAQMRTGSEYLELLPGQSVGLSGPLTIKNPVHSDLVARFTPENAPLAFNLEGFFAGYWFGNGMWRALVTADSLAEPGVYQMRAAFRGASAKSAQHFTVVVRADEAAMRAGSASMIRRLTGYNPFVVAAIFGGLAVFGGIGVYLLGCRHIRLLMSMGCCEVVRVRAEQGGCRLWCMLAGLKAPGEGATCAVFSCDGAFLGEAVAEPSRKGALELTMPACGEARPGCLVCLRPPRAKPASPA